MKCYGRLKKLLGKFGKLLNLLISGYTGFVGTHLLSYLTNHKKFKNIYCLGRKKPKNIDKKIKYLNLNKKSISKNTIKIDVFLHLAGSTEIYSKNYKVSYEANVSLLLKMISYKELKISRLIYFSTAQIYGSQYNINESSKSDLKNYYSLTNFHAESIVRLLYGNNFSNYTIIRPFNIYGIYSNKDIERDTLVPTCFCKEIISKGTITLLSSGEQYRDFISLKEFSKSVLKIIFSKSKFKNKTVNLCSGVSLKIIEVAKICVNEYKSIF